MDALLILPAFAVVPLTKDGIWLYIGLGVLLAGVVIAIIRARRRSRK